jgi:hypothetical protein
MALRDPVAIFNADTNVEAQLVRTLLVDAGIEAFVVEDVSYVGTCALGTLSEINKPQVWVERTDVEKALDFLDEYEQRAEEPETEAGEGRFCYHCGGQVPEGQTVCGDCGKPLVEAEQDDCDASEPDRGAVREPEQGEDEQHDGLAAIRGFKKPLAWLFLAFLTGPFLLAILGAIVELVGRLAGEGR